MPVYVDSLSDNAPPSIVRRLSKARLDGIRSYPNAIALIAAFIGDTGTPFPAVKFTVTGSAELLSHERSLIREVFGIEPHSDHSLYEAFEIACECSAHDGIHVSGEDLVPEVVNDKGAPLPPGVEGRILVTNLHSYGMPLIRYDLGDSGTTLTATGRAVARYPVSVCSSAGRTGFSSREVAYVYLPGRSSWNALQDSA